MWDDGEKRSCREEPSKVCAAASTLSQHQKSALRPLVASVVS
nr:MAG TPA: hypothetical protein [Caudoviricetes sp.]